MSMHIHTEGMDEVVQDIINQHPVQVRLGMLTEVFDVLDAGVSWHADLMAELQECISSGRELASLAIQSQLQLHALGQHYLPMHDCVLCRPLIDMAD